MQFPNPRPSTTSLVFQDVEDVPEAGGVTFETAPIHKSCYVPTRWRTPFSRHLRPKWSWCQGSDSGRPPVPANALPRHAFVGQGLWMMSGAQPAIRAQRSNQHSLPAKEHRTVRKAWSHENQITIERFRVYHSTHSLFSNLGGQLRDRSWQS